MPEGIIRKCQISDVPNIELAVLFMSSLPALVILQFQGNILVRVIGLDDYGYLLVERKSVYS